MVDNRETLNITGGMDVFGNDGEKVGSVAGVEGDYMVVSKGFFFPTDYYIPASAIQSADDDGVYLNVTRDDALNQGWDTVPEAGSTTASGTDQATAAQGTLDTNGTYTDPSAGEYVDTNDATLDEPATTRGADTTRASSDTVNVPVTEEELVAGVKDVERGKVQVEKVVSEEERSIDVPVTEERVNVTHRAVDRGATDDDVTFEGSTIDIPVKGQDVAVGKRSHVIEEVEISKDRVQDTRTVTDTVRKEDVRVKDSTGNLVDEGKDAVEDTVNTARNKAKDVL